MPLQFSKYLKIEVEVVVARNSFQAEAVDKGKMSKKFVEKSAVVFMNEDFARRNGFKEGDIVRLSRRGRSINVKVFICETSPRDGVMMPNSIYSSYLADFDNFKRFRAYIELSDGDVTKPDEIIDQIKNKNKK